MKFKLFIFLFIFSFFSRAQESSSTSAPAQDTKASELPTGRSQLIDELGKVTDSYIRDPSVLNWHALELAVRGELIGDFPLNNKSFNLSYAGFDL